MEQKRFLLSFLTLLLSTIMYAQQEITGTVTDAFGPVIGATVMEKGTTNGTVTDFDGNFKLKVEAGKMLVFSYVGYLTQELPAANGTPCCQWYGGSYERRQQAVAGSGGDGLYYPT